MDFDTGSLEVGQVGHDLISSLVKTAFSVPYKRAIEGGLAVNEEATWT